MMPMLLYDRRNVTKYSCKARWSGNGTTRAFVRGVTRTLARVFKRSEVEGAHPNRFRHTLATALLEKGWTTEDVADVLGSTPEIIRKHYAQWTVQRQ